MSFGRARQPEQIQAVLAESEFAPLRADYRQTLFDTARLLLTALVSEVAPASDEP